MKDFDINYVPVFKPTWEEFKDFNKYITQIEAAGAHHAGICKIIPPREWVPRQGSYDDVDEMVISAPIIQRAHGSHGIFLQTLHVKPKMTVGQIRQLANSPAYRTPDHNDWAHLEKKYWANIGLSNAFYGADVCGTITDADQKYWNIAHLGSILDDVFSNSGVEIKGVNTPYLYFGTWRATFAWHTEDVDLYSINYIHYGMPKQWYVIPPQYARRFEALAREYYKTDYLRCKSFLRHKTCLISPSVLQVAGIPVNKITQEQGEIMITFPYGYHCGYNLGFNMAESTNFASTRWIEYGKKATVCHCRVDSVKIQMDPFVARYQPEQYADWMSGRDTSPHPLDLLYSSNLSGSEKRRRLSSGNRRGRTLSCSSDDASSGRHSPPPPPLKKRPAGIALNRDGECTPTSNGHQGNNSDEENMPALPDFLLKFPGIWSGSPPDFEAEKTFNAMLSSHEPYCAICCVLWTPPRVADILAGKASKTEILESSEPQIPEEAFLTNSIGTHRTDANKIAAESSASYLIRCTVCHVRVHASCYGVPQMDKNPSGLDKWKCDRCEEGATTAQCCLCPIRGGAIKRLDSGDMPSLSPAPPYENHTTCHATSGCIKRSKTPSLSLPPPPDRPAEPGLGDWAHVVCALGTYDVRFTNVTKRRAQLPPYVPAWADLVCTVCQAGNKAAPLAKCVYAVCKSRLHVTCAHLGGVIIESLSHPWSFYISCQKHKKLYSKFEIRVYLPLKQGEKVYAKHPYNKRFYKAIAKKRETDLLYCIDFLDGTYSSDVPVKYILDRDCAKLGPPPEGSYVRVMWNDNKEYKGLFRGITPEKWEIEFETSDVVTLSREYVYKIDEDIPPKIRRRISTYAEKPF